MDSFLNKVEREADLEVQRIRSEAQQLVDVLKALKLEVPQDFLQLAYPVHYTPSVSIKEAVTALENLTEDLEPKKKQDHSKRIAKIQAKAEADYQETRTAIREVLSKGPKPRSEVIEQLPYNENRITNAGTRMKKEGELNYRTAGYQGSTLWFLVERPVTLEQLRDEVVDRKGGDIPLQETQTKLGFRDLQDLYRMLDELVEQGIIRRTENDTYENFADIRNTPNRDTRTLHEKKKYSRVVNGVTGTGRRAKLSASKEVQQILAKAEAMGAQTKKQGNDHIQVKLGDKTVVLSSSPGDNNRANREKLKDLGVNV